MCKSNYYTQKSELSCEQQYFSSLSWNCKLQDDHDHKNAKHFYHWWEGPRVTSPLTITTSTSNWAPPYENPGYVPVMALQQLDHAFSYLSPVSRGKWLKTICVWSSQSDKEVVAFPQYFLYAVVQLCLLLVLAITASFSESSVVNAVMYSFFIHLLK